MLEVEYQLDKSDGRAFAWHLMPPGEARGWLAYWPIIAVPLLFASCCAPELIYGRFPILGLIGCGLGVLYMLLGCYVVMIELWRAGRRVKRKAQREGMIKLGIAADGLSYSDQIRQTFLKWNGLLRIDETPTHAYFFVAKKEAFILPARVFASAIEFHSFVGLARTFMENSEPNIPQRPMGPPDAITRPTDITT